MSSSKSTDNTIRGLIDLEGTRDLLDSMYRCVVGDETEPEVAFRVLVSSVADIHDVSLSDEAKIDTLREALSRLEVQRTRETQPERT